VNPLSSLPAVPETALPASVRARSAQDKQEYGAALGFEQVLLQQVVAAIVPEDSDLAGSPYASAVQDAFAQGLTASGGIGLGAQLFETMQRTRS
jgi:Rod binding domain-containing protein